MSDIDFVVTWVDNQDIEWRNKKNHYLSKSDENFTEAEIGDERFRDYGTLLYLFRSIEKYANWVHHVYLITDGQKPDWLKLNNNKVTVIDHQDILPKGSLPTFNSDVIECGIPKIPNLAEKFVYFNDDILINKKVSPEDFFIDDKPRDSRIYSPITPNGVYDKITFSTTMLINQWLDGRWPISKQGIKQTIFESKAQLFNLYMQKRRHAVLGYWLTHTANSYTKQSFNKAEEIWKNELSSIQNNQFRDVSDVSITLLVRYLQLELGNFIPRKLDFSELYSLKDLDRIIKDLKEEQHSIICINDADISNFDKVTSVLDKKLSKKYNKKSLFEL